MYNIVFTAMLSFLLGWQTCFWLEEYHKRTTRQQLLFQHIEAAAKGEYVFVRKDCSYFNVKVSNEFLQRGWVMIIEDSKPVYYYAKVLNLPSLAKKIYFSR